MHHVFPKWTNLLLPGSIIVLAVAPFYVLLMVTYGFSPRATDVGYQPPQPIPFSHAVHAGRLGLDCRYCHNTVEHAAKAAIPPTETCMNCHTQIKKDSELLKPLFESHETGNPIPWVRVHDLPDYAYFNHSAHVSRGIGCASCHGRIDRMEVVYQQQPLSMGWCLECHRNPEPHLRPLDEITNLAYDPLVELTPQQRRQFRIDNSINPSQDCSTCHR
ncbi:MAG: cytochrome c3 family protein [Phycisphaerales bacterium]|nr:MAG: cytochrome c3 family protein [Phycisphaerales bacterium]